MANERRANPPGCSRTRWRRLTTGSSTAPVVPRARGRPARRDGRGRGPGPEIARGCFPFSRRLRPSIDAQRVEGPGGRLGCGAWPATAEQSGTVGQVLGLDEQLAEGRMRDVVFLPPEHDLGVARDLDFSHCSLLLVSERRRTSTSSSAETTTSSWDSMPSSVRRNTARSLENVTRYSSGSWAIGWYVADQSLPERTSRR